MNLTLWPDPSVAAGQAHRMSLLRSDTVNLYNYCTFIQYPVLARVARTPGGPPFDADGT